MTLDVERLRKVAQMCLLNKSVRNIAALNGCSPSTAVRIGSFIEKDPAIRNKGSVDIFSGSFNFQTVNP